MFIVYIFITCHCNNLLNSHANRTTIQYIHIILCTPDNNTQTSVEPSNLNLFMLCQNSKRRLELAIPHIHIIYYYYNAMSMYE